MSLLQQRWQPPPEKAASSDAAPEGSSLGKKKSKHPPSGVAAEPLSQESNKRAAEEKKARPVAPKKPKPNKVVRPETTETVPLSNKSLARKRQRKRTKARRAARERAAQFKPKDPEVAAKYLQAWQSRDTDGGWKFNKATQTWLLRHMYDSAAVPKDVFGICLQYIAGVQGAARDRVKAEADAVVLMQGAPLTEPSQDAPGDGAENPAGEQAEATEQEDARVRKVRLKRAQKVQAALAEASVSDE
mmetsp:Transcript_51342/g.94881  ORF Transcript_51342/g.94881 Transcript_51342/m.94881 type:complete len:245 (+) Transcript_51342:109-843(+)